MTLLDIPREEWQHRAACIGKTELFFPREDENKNKRRSVAAKNICRLCIVKHQCLDYAIRTNELHGIWGGMDPKERGMEQRKDKYANGPAAPYTTGYRQCNGCDMVSNLSGITLHQKSSGHEGWTNVRRPR